MLNKIIISNRWGSVVSQRVDDASPDSEYIYMQRPHAIAIVAIKQGQVLLVNQHRIPVKDSTWELPSGAVEEDETLEDAVRRELEEETNCVVTGQLSLLFDAYEAPAYSSVKVSVYRAEVSQHSKLHSLNDSHEVISLRWLNIGREVRGFIQESRMDSITIAGLGYCGLL